MDETDKSLIEAHCQGDLTAFGEIHRNFGTVYWDLEKKGDFDFEQVDKDTVKFTLKLDPHSKKQFSYTLTTRHGTRAE